MELPTQATAPGCYWKIPFTWEPVSSPPFAVQLPEPSELRFERADPGWLTQALAAAMETTPDESDLIAVRRAGAVGAATELLAISPEYFEHPDGWWQAAVDPEGRSVGFVLPALFKDRSRWSDGRPEGTIVYIAVLAEHRGRGYSHTLLREATRLLAAAGCRRILCDTASNNLPMIRAFRSAGYSERTPWQRPLEWPLPPD